MCSSTSTWPVARNRGRQLSTAHPGPPARDERLSGRCLRKFWGHNRGTGVQTRSFTVIVASAALRLSSSSIITSVPGSPFYDSSETMHAPQLQLRSSSRRGGGEGPRRLRGTRRPGRSRVEWACSPVCGSWRRWAEGARPLRPNAARGGLSAIPAWCNLIAVCVQACPSRVITRVKMFNQYHETPMTCASPVASRATSLPGPRPSS